MSRFLRRDDRGVGSEWEMNSWEGYQIGLEFVEIDIESSVEAERTGDAGNYLGNQAVQVGEGWRGNSEVASTDVVDGLVVNHEGAVDVLERSVGSQDRVVLQSVVRCGECWSVLAKIS